LFARGVDHGSASHATLPNSAFNGTLSHWLPSLWSRVVVVGQLVRFTVIANSEPDHPGRANQRSFASDDRRSICSSAYFGVGHEPEPLSDMRSPDARSRDTDWREGVTFSFQVILNKVEPPVGNRCFNLFTKDNWRSLRPYKMEPMRP